VVLDGASAASLVKRCGLDPLGGHGGGGKAFDATPGAAVHTSTLQQEANRKLDSPLTGRFGGAETVRFRRDLVSPDRLDDPVRQGAAESGPNDPGNVWDAYFGGAPVSDECQENAQEAHEAIGRPTSR